jgi:hypothetical protein
MFLSPTFSRARSPKVHSKTASWWWGYRHSRGMGSPIRRLLSRGKIPPFTTCCCVFSAHLRRMTRMGRAHCYAPLISVVVVSGPQRVRTSHPSGSRPREGCHHADFLTAPGHPWPQKTVGTTPRPRRVITALRAPVWVQPLAGSRRRRTSRRTGSCEADGGMGPLPIRSGGCQPTPSRAHGPSPLPSECLSQTPWLFQTGPDPASYNNRLAPTYGPPP